MATRHRRSVLTAIACAASVIVTFGSNSGGESSYEAWGYRDASDVWGGAYWALITSTFVHGSFLHLFYNTYWLWELGGRLERTVGALPWLMLFLLSAVVSSAAQLAVSDDTGIGMSGVVYAIFGFMWVAQSRYPTFAAVVGPRTAGIMIAWLGFCIIADRVGVMSVGNGAHVSGIVFGMLLAASLAGRWKRWVSVPATALFAAACVIPVFW